MKKIIFIAAVFLIMISCNSQDKRPLIGASLYQQQLNANYKDASKSPLKKKDLKKFKGLDFFNIDTTFIVKATFTKINNAPIFEMATTTDRKPLYKEYGLVNFTINGKNIMSNIDQHPQIVLS